MAGIKLKLKRLPDFESCGAELPAEGCSAEIRDVAIRGEYIKLDSFLKFAGAVMTGGEAKGRIQAGGVLVCGEVCTMRGRKLRPGDTVEAGGTVYRVTAP